MEDPSSNWDREYHEGRWHFLNDIKEAARYGILSAWLGQCDAADKVLDVGCGEAIFYHYLKTLGLKHYCGVDLSEAALARAKVDLNHAELIKSDLVSYTCKPEQRYSAIVFNEVLYFCENPEIQLRKYAGYLSDNGVIAISMYAPDRETSGANKTIKKVWQETDNSIQWRVLDDLELKSSAKNVGWKLRLIQPINISE